MPEFVLDTGSAASRQRFKSLDSFTQGYIEAMFFCGVGDIELGDLNLDRLAPDAWEQITSDCGAFQVGNAAALAAAVASKPTYDMEQAGRDFWFTRNGHGTGYSARSLPDDIETELERAAHVAGEVDLYAGDDGLLYF